MVSVPAVPLRSVIQFDRKRGRLRHPLQGRDGIAPISRPSPYMRPSAGTGLPSAHEIQELEWVCGVGSREYGEHPGTVVSMGGKVQHKRRYFSSLRTGTAPHKMQQGVDEAAGALKARGNEAFRDGAWAAAAAWYSEALEAGAVGAERATLLSNRFVVWEAGAAGVGWAHRPSSPLDH